jgi:hypothetical protein
MTANWTAPTSNAEAHRRAAGRRRYNAMRHWLQVARRNRLLGCTRTGYGVQAALARVLGVSRSTICRDLAAIAAGYKPTKLPVQGGCGASGHALF